MFTKRSEISWRVVLFSESVSQKKTKTGWIKNLRVSAVGFHFMKGRDDFFVSSLHLMNDKSGSAEFLTCFGQQTTFSFLKLSKRPLRLPLYGEFIQVLYLWWIVVELFSIHAFSFQVCHVCAYPKTIVSKKELWLNTFTRLLKSFWQQTKLKW